MAGVFGLSDFRVEQLEGNIDESANYGYFGGGSSAYETGSSTVDRIDFFNETTSAPGNNLNVVGQARDYMAAVYTPNYGYFGGGKKYAATPPYSDLINRIDFSNETASLPGNNLTQKREDLGGVFSPEYGYFAGGFHSPGVNTIDRIDFTTETVAAPPVGDNLPGNRYGMGSVSNLNYGYFGGGFTPLYSCVIDRIDFTNETVAIPPVGDQLTQARRGLAGVFTPDFGYFGGGFSGTPPTLYWSTVDRIDFTTETTSTPGNHLPESRRHAAGVFNFNYGYFGGGYLGPTSPPYETATIDRIDFNTETTSAPGNNLPQARSSTASVSGGKSINAEGFKKYRTDKIVNPISKKNAYFAGGWNPSAPDASLVVDRMDYSSETVTNLTEGALPEKTSYLRSVVSENNYGYSAGGYSPSVPNRTNVVSRIDFSNETQSLPGKNLSVNRDVWASTYNNNYGYFVAGNTLPSTTTVNTVDRIDFSNEVLSSPSIGQLPQEMFNGPTGIIFTSYCGYFAGGRPTGFTNANQCVTYRLDFTTETFGNLSTGDVMSVKRDRLSSHASSDYGYLVGGDEPTVLSTIDRLDFSNEVLTLYPTAILPSPGRMLFAATGNKSYAYYAGGWHGIDDIDRMDYSTETVGDIPSSLSQGRYGLTGL